MKRLRAKLAAAGVASLAGTGIGAAVLPGRDAYAWYTDRSHR